MSDDRRTPATAELGGVVSELWNSIKQAVKGFMP
jgi:hypothetical protein